MTVKFEVGKRYTGKKTQSLFRDCIIRILWVGEKKMVATYEKTNRHQGSFVSIGKELLWDIESCSLYWEEYHEPKIEKFRKVVVRPSDGGPFLANCIGSHRYITQVGEIEITLTDGKLTDVKILGD